MIEVLVVTALTTSLLLLGTGAIRSLWLNRSLSGGADEFVMQLRSLGSKVEAETNVRVYGVALTPGADTYDVLRHDVVPGQAGTCSVLAERSLPGGVEIASASTPIEGDPATACRGQLGIESTTALVFFYARGTATSADVLLEQPQLERCRAVTVRSITARVTAEAVSCP